MALLDHATLRELHAAALSTNLSRSAVLAGINPGFVASLPSEPSPSSQVLQDLNRLNDAGTLGDGSVPLRIWLDNALTLSAPRREAIVFERAREQLNGASRAPREGEPARTASPASSPSRSVDDQVDVVCLTALGLEQAAVTGLLESVSDVELSTGTIVEVGRLRASRGTRVAVVLGGQGLVAAATTAQEVIAHFRPKVVLMVGVAGGIKDVRVGDVVASTKVYGYESGRAADEFLPRPDVGISSYRLVQRAMHESLRSAWLKRLDPEPQPPPKVLVGPIAAGSAVVASTRAPIYQFLRKHYSDALAVEMEGRGVLEAAYRHKSDAIVVRGISDLIDDKAATDARGSQPLAARNAAAFALEVAEKALS
jgi:nucleoside phosphorylase